MRLIDADDFENRIKQIYCIPCKDYNGVRCRACWVDEMLTEVDCQPTAYDVEAVADKLENHITVATKVNNGEWIYSFGLTPKGVIDIVRKGGKNGQDY